MLLVDATNPVVPYAAVDAWEVRGLGRLDRRAPSRCLERLLLQIRPSHIVVLVRDVGRPLQGLGRGLRVAARHGLKSVPLNTSDLRRLLRLEPSIPDLARDFPEVRHLLPAVGANRALIQTLRLALAVLFHHPLPPRSYAPPGFSPRPSPRVAR